MTRRAVAGAVVALIVAVAGCTDDAAPAMTKAEYVDEGNQICADADDALAQAAEEAGVPEGDLAAQVAFVQTQSVPAIRRQIDDLRGLGFPPGDEDELDDLLDDSEDTLILVGRDPASLLRTDGQDPFASVDERLTDYGLDDCGGS